MFGISNQLLAAIALGVGTTILIRENKLKYIWVTLLPMLFMFITTFTAAWQQIGIFRAQVAKAASASEIFTFKLDIFLVALMALLAVVALADMLYRWYRTLKGDTDVPAPGGATVTPE
jgi:carbon starvation protein